MAITAAKVHAQLDRLIEQVNESGVPVEIGSPNGDAVLLSRAEYEALEETGHLLRVPANARRLLESLDQARSSGRRAPARDTL